MSYIPNVRNQFEEKPVKILNDDGVSCHFETKLTRNAYWQGFLNERGKMIVREFDWTVWEGLCLFDNLDSYDEQLSEALDIRMTDERRENIANVFREIYEDWMEGRRTELVVSLLESDDEYSAYPEEWAEDGVPSDEAPEGYQQREDGLEGLEGLEPWAEDDPNEE